MITTEAERMEKTDTDRIEKKVQLAAPRSRVWRALTDARQFGEWFRIKLDGEFAEGKTVRGPILSKGFEHLTIDMLVEKIEPERYFSYRWHPYPIDPKVDYSKEQTTLVEFILEENGGVTDLTIVESGFDNIPLSRRGEAFRMNDKGWEGQARNLERYVTQP